ncbi:2-keto-3-deoxygluconate kinase [Modestobacter sp. DSM 44400]|uniref:sugar kinase n=1 Tax=Modestobacter sp. DSM 44400 TaxID=1550230 RepID=UPI000895A488|nr:sugar kinase [Modestobacter sp. DSM 44400]SDY11753.1 2-keto-3-deoxygluconate kinase [Modestobacter sp. DSM 44400]
MSATRTVDLPCSLDAVTFGEVMAMFVAQEPGPLELVSTYRRALAGAETNLATGLARLGHPVGWIGRVGDDPFGRFALAELAGANVDISTVTLDSDAPTGFQLKSRAEGGDPDVVYFRRDSAGSRLAASPATDSYIATARHLHLTGIPLALSASTRAFAFRAVDVARAAGATISFDPNLRPSLWASPEEMVRVVNDMAARADWVLPGAGEGYLLTGRNHPPGIAGFYLDQGASRVIVKCGAAGASAYTTAERWNQPIFPVAAVDTVGAGDGFAAGLISAHLDGLDLTGQLRRAAAVGALATTSPGDKDGLPTREQLNTFLDGRPVQPTRREDRPWSCK